MRRAVILLVLLAVPEGAAAAPAEKVGWFLPAKNKVLGNLPGDQPVSKKTGEPVLAEFWVSTGKASGAGIPLAWNGRLQGEVTIGSESQFQIHKPSLTAAGEDRFDFRIDWGKFLFQNIPRWRDDPVLKELGVRPHEVRLTIPDRRYPDDSKKEKDIWLRGTEVRVFVDRQTGATSVYVTEGQAVVRAAGREVTVPELQWTYVPPDGPPTPPAPLPSHGEARSPEGGGRILEILQDPFLNPRDPRLGLDLPR